MIRAAFPGSLWLIVIAWLTLAGGCARFPDTGKTLLKPKSYSELRGYLLDHKADLDQFRLLGPFAVAVKEDFEIRLPDSEVIKADLYLSAHAEKAPLVVIVHGLDSTKELHAFQAMHLASWGMHSLAVQLPNQGPWIANGKTLASIVLSINRRPEAVDRRIDAGKIVLAGHSFGGAAVTVALAEGAPAAGGILLDPAIGERDFPRLLRLVSAPVMLLGADTHVSAARNRDYFYRYIRGRYSEVSIRDAAHEDAQYPSNVGVATEELQITFASAMTSAAFSLSSAGNFDYAWASYGDALARGKFFDAKKK